MSTSTTNPSSQQPSGVWPTLAPYVIPPIAASFAIIPAFRGMTAKSALQRGEAVARFNALESLKGGVGAAPTVGLIIGFQMIFQGAIEKKLIGDESQADLSSKLKSSAIVGFTSSPALAVFNGQTIGWPPRKSLQKFTPKQGAAITAQESAFVMGLSAAEPLADKMKIIFGDNRVIEYIAAYMSGGLGSLAGHPANTALTRWQSDMTVSSLRQSMWGAARKARAVGLLSIGYKLVKDTLNSTVESPD